MQVEEELNHQGTKGTKELKIQKWEFRIESQELESVNSPLTIQNSLFIDFLFLVILVPWWCKSSEIYHQATKTTKPNEEA